MSSAKFFFSKYIVKQGVPHEKSKGKAWWYALSFALVGSSTPSGSNDTHSYLSAQKRSLDQTMYMQDIHGTRAVEWVGEGLLDRGTA